MLMKWFHFLGAIALIFVSISYAAAAPDLGAPPAVEPSVESSADTSQNIVVENIPPLYTQPRLPGEGIWVKEDMSGGNDATDLAYRTVYRPSDKFPNAVVYMLLLNMKRLAARLFLGSAEPYGKGSVPKLEQAAQSQLVAITNALWQTAHAGQGGIILRGQVLKKMDPGLATIVFYKNETVDILEWKDDIEVSEVQDARQLKHLIVKDGKVVTCLMKRGQALSSEIGLGSLLNEDRPVIQFPAASPEAIPIQQLNFTSGDLWFIATRSGFGIRPDGNLVFAVGHHISTCDLAKGLALAGSVRAMHGDANPGNCVGVLYFTEGNGKIVGKIGLSPHQDKSTLDRYLKGSYPKDFFAFLRR